MVVYWNEVAESGVGTIDSDESASLATLHLQIGRGCSPPSTSERKNFQIGKVSASQQAEFYNTQQLLTLLCLISAHYCRYLYSGKLQIHKIYTLYALKHIVFGILVKNYFVTL